LKYILFVIGIILTLIIVWQDIRTYLGDNFDPIEGYMRKSGNKSVLPRWMLVLPLYYFTYIIKSYIFSYAYGISILSIICIPNTILFYKYYSRSKRKRDLFNLVALAIYDLLMLILGIWGYWAIFK